MNPSIREDTEDPEFKIAKRFCFIVLKFNIFKTFNANENKDAH